MAHIVWILSGGARCFQKIIAKCRPWEGEVWPCKLENGRVMRTREGMKEARLRASVLRPHVLMFKATSEALQTVIEEQGASPGVGLVQNDAHRKHEASRTRLDEAVRGERWDEVCAFE